MKTTFDLPTDLVREIKLRAVMQGRSVKDYVAELLRSALGQPVQPPTKVTKSSRVSINELGFPIIRGGAHAPATKMRVEALIKLEQEALQVEDLNRAAITR